MASALCTYLRWITTCFWSGTHHRDSFQKLKSITAFMTAKAAEDQATAPSIWHAKKRYYMTTFTSPGLLPSMLAKMLLAALTIGLKPVWTCHADNKERMFNTWNYMHCYSRTSGTMWNMHKGSPPNSTSTQQLILGMVLAKAPATLVSGGLSKPIALSKPMNPKQNPGPCTLPITNTTIVSYLTHSLTIQIFAPQQPRQNFPNFLATLQMNINLWHDLLQASGGVLNPSKCVWLCFYWQIGPHGWPKITQPPKSAALQLTVHGQPPVLIPLLDPAAPHRYLGVYLTMDGNYKMELSTFQQCNNKYIQLMRSCPFSTWEAFVVYRQCYLLTVSYPLLATLMPPDWLYKLQSLATSVFLTKLGFPCTFLRAIAYASTDWGGVVLVMSKVFKNAYNYWNISEPTLALAQSTR